MGKGVRETEEATEDQIARAPVGDYTHRIWTCPRHVVPRKQLANEQDLRAVKDVDVRGHPAWERALVARPPMPRRKKSKVEPIVWHVKPKSMPIKGIIYSDGSARDGPIKELVRCGWAFVVVDEEGQVIAAAYGLPPPWIDDIGGAEVWGLHQAMLVTTPCSPAWVDCLPVLTAVEKGMQVANDPRNPLARAHALLLPLLEDEGVERAGWMPAHLKSADLKHAMATKSDGSLVTKVDVMTNDLADRLAKQTVEAHRVPQGEVQSWKAEMAKV